MNILTSLIHSLRPFKQLQEMQKTSNQKNYIFVNETENIIESYQKRLALKTHLFHIHTCDGVNTAVNDQSTILQPLSANHLWFTNPSHQDVCLSHLQQKPKGAQTTIIMIQEIYNSKQVCINRNVIIYYLWNT